MGKAAGAGGLGKEGKGKRKSLQSEISILPIRKHIHARYRVNNANDKGSSN